MARNVKIIVRAPNWLGDCIMATPMLRRLRELNPEACITVMGLESHRAVLEGNTAIDDMMLFDSFKKFKGFSHAVSAIRSEGFDKGYILPNSLSSAALFYLGRVRERTGYIAEGRGLFLNRGLSWPGQVEHRVLRYMRLVEDTPDLAVKAEGYSVEMAFGEDEKALADGLLEGIDPAGMVALNPCCITSTRRWPEDRFASLARRISDETGFSIVLVGGPSVEDADTCARVAKLSGVPGIRNLAGKTRIKSLAALLSRARLLVTANTGTMHVAAAAGVPMVVMTGSSDINITAPWGVDYRVVMKNLPCYPCWKNECPLDPVNPECMNALSVEDVFVEVKSLLADEC